MKSGSYFPNLDGIRFIAFLMVFSLHYYATAIDTLGIEEGNFKAILLQFIANGTAGVHIFFVLSGFLITYLLLKEKEKTGKINVIYFYIRRALRIWPLYFVIIGFSLVIYPVIRIYFDADAPLYYKPLYYIFFLGNFDIINIQRFHDGIIPGFLEVTWSLSIEEQFYAVWPLLFVLVPKRAYVFIFYSTILSSIIFNGYAEFKGLTYIGRHTLSVMYLLSFGGLAAYYSIYSKPFIAFFQSLPKQKIRVVYMIGFIIFAFMGLVNENDHIGYMVFSVLLALFFVFVIVEQNYCDHSFFKFSSNKFITKWGKYTYGLYMLHNIAGIIILGVCRLLKIELITFTSLFFSSTLILLLSFLLSYISYHVLEEKVLRWKKKVEVL